MGLFGNKEDKGKITKKFADGGYLREYKNGTTERVSFTKTREIHKFDGPYGKSTIYGRRK